MEALDKAIRLSRKTGRPKPPKKIPRTYEGMDERELKIIDRLAAMTVDERLRFNNYQSEFLLMHKINSGEFVDYKELATLDEESLKQFMNSVIDHIVVRERKIVEIVFTNGLSHTLLYK